MSDVSRATSVPLMPIATPTSALRRAGASFTPSPVISTTSWYSLSVRRMSTLWRGSARAKMLVSLTTRLSSASSSASSSFASMASPSNPTSRPIAAAVRLLSPVIITTRMPARCGASMACVASGLGGSLIAPNAANVSPTSIIGASAGCSLYANASTRSACPASPTFCSNSALRSSSLSADTPSGVRMLVQSGNTASSAPFASSRPLFLPGAFDRYRHHLALGRERDFAGPLVLFQRRSSALRELQQRCLRRVSHVAKFRMPTRVAAQPGDQQRHPERPPLARRA